MSLMTGRTPAHNSLSNVLSHLYVAHEVKKTLDAQPENTYPLSLKLLVYEALSY
jgi:hypothetical protein